MGRIVNILSISADARSAVDQAYRSTNDKRYATRCRIILLKSDPLGYTNASVAQILDITPVVVTTWLKRYREEGLPGLTSRPIPGRPGILNFYQDGPTVKEQVKLARQRLGKAHQKIEEAVGKQFSPTTLRRFLKDLTVATSVSVSDRDNDPTLNSTKA